LRCVGPVEALANALLVAVEAGQWALAERLTNLLTQLATEGAS
jgi:hypothetical protein